MRGYASKVFPPKMLHFIEELIYYGAYNLSGTSILGPKKEKKKEVALRMLKLNEYWNY